MVFDHGKVDSIRCYFYGRKYSMGNQWHAVLSCPGFQDPREGISLHREARDLRDLSVIFLPHD